MTADARRTLLVVTVCVALVAAGVGSIAAWQPHPSPRPADDASASASPGDDPITRLHAAGVTGENVTVGIVDPTGFDLDRTNRSANVVATRTFGTESSVRNGGRNDHGTAAATTVARVAPDANLALATFDSPAGFREAVAWAVESDVDVVVAPVSFLGAAGDGSGAVSRAATNATREGVVFVAPTGNIARGHWRGRYDAVENGTLRFGETNRAYLSGDRRRVTVWISWDEARSREDYTAELYRTSGGRTRLVARSQPYGGDGVPNERLVALAQPGTYHVVVRGPENATGTRLELESPTHDFRRATPKRSLTAPATAPGVLAVGAYDPRTGRPEPFSSRGPTADGRLGVDVVAPDRGVAPTTGEAFVGSSAAAPYVGGAAALILSVAPERSPREVEVALERTAADAGRPGADFATGHGRIDPVAAVRAASEAANRTAREANATAEPTTDRSKRDLTYG
ncbi:S8 family serine peptidase [Halopelagius longus]|uniref:Subtilase family protein n=1 Tax=Halopelagius longus TaxID=1236180 RepID=A0A1H0YC53_9EURY|nr:S8 family serine peptidase [Halopelagius longus]RDI72409.1 subtilase protease [Halopelagius longus]SDQ12775.1 Subtilase family protein [Halopelagius longus]